LTGDSRSNLQHYQFRPVRARRPLNVTPSFAPIHRFCLPCLGGLDAIGSIEVAAPGIGINGRNSQISCPRLSPGETLVLWGISMVFHFRLPALPAVPVTMTLAPIASPMQAQAQAQAQASAAISVTQGTVCCGSQDPRIGIHRFLGDTFGEETQEKFASLSCPPGMPGAKAPPPAPSAWRSRSGRGLAASQSLSEHVLRWGREREPWLAGATTRPFGLMVVNF
jgi:hypothetical protein